MEQMKYKNEDIALIVESQYEKPVYGFPDSQDSMYHNQFVIRITKDITDPKFNDWQIFTYYGSYADYQKNITALSERDMRFALGCIISDALSGLMSFDEFCGEFGYDEDSRRAERIHKKCIETSEKIQKLGINEDDMYRISNDLYNDE